MTEAIKFNLSNLIVPGLTYKVPAHGQFLFLERRQFPKRSFGDLGGLPPCLELGGLRVANAPAVLCIAKSYRLWGIDPPSFIPTASALRFRIPIFGAHLALGVNERRTVGGHRGVEQFYTDCCFQCEKAPQIVGLEVRRVSHVNG